MNASAGKRGVPLLRRALAGVAHALRRANAPAHEFPGKGRKRTARNPQRSQPFVGDADVDAIRMLLAPLFGGRELRGWKTANNLQFSKRCSIRLRNPAMVCRL